jgi:hypothetical protein
VSQNWRTTAICCNISEAGCFPSQYFSEFFIDLSTTSLIILNATRTGGGGFSCGLFVNTAARATEKHPQSVKTVSDSGPEPRDLSEASATLCSVRRCH